jgi:hypothetical protein
MFQAIIDHFIPSAIVNLSSIFQEWNVLHQEKNELAVVHSSRVAKKLAGCSKRAGQEFTKSSQILTFVEGLHEGFADFSKDCFSSRLSFADTALHDATALAKTIELSMDKATIAPRTRESRRGRARCANGATPDNASVEVSSGPLSRAQVDELFVNSKCPLHWVNNHTCCECYAFSDHAL